jgi:predicted MFS family arabinose efflux permease
MNQQAAKAHRATALLALAAFSSGANLRVSDALVPKLAHDFDATVEAAAFVVTGFTLAYGLFQLVSGPLGDRAGKLRTVSIALAIAAAGSVGCAYAPSLGWLIGLRFLTGIGAGAIVPLAIAFIGDNVTYENRQLALGRFISAVLLGQAFGPLIGGVLSEHVSWRQSYFVLGVLFLAVSIPLGLEGKRQPTNTAPLPHYNPLARYAELLRDHWIRVVVFTVAVEGFLFYGMLAYLGAFLHTRFDLGLAMVGLVLTGFSIGGLLYSVSVKALIWRLGERGLVRAGALIMAVCCAAIALSAEWLIAFPFFILIGFGFYMMHNTLQTRASEMAPLARGSAVSLFAFCLFLGQAAGVAAFGRGIAAFGYIFSLCCAGVGLLVLGEWFRRQLGLHRAQTLKTAIPDERSKTT